MAVNEILEIYPPVETLSKSIKGRPKVSLNKNVKNIYHCPIQTCKYYKNEFYFDKMKFLKQHFVKVHKTKSFSCNKCGKCFPLEATLNRHESICGVIYRCHCNAEYSAYEAFLTHTKRKHHRSTLKYKDMMICLKVHTTAQKFQKCFDNSLKVQAIIVEDTNRQKLLYFKKKKLSKSESSKETQTGVKMCKILPNVSAHTQTTVSIQTSTDSGIKKRKKCKTPININKVNHLPLTEKNVSFSTSSTQTTPIKDEKLSILQKNLTKCADISRLYSTHNDLPRTELQTSLPSIAKNSSDRKIKNEFDTYFEESSDNSNLSMSFNDEKMMSFADDPNLGSCQCFNLREEDSASRLTETQTNSNNTELFLNEILKTDPNLIMYSDSETQTAFEDYFDSSYIDTYTQTFSDLNFVDIQTQTSWSRFNDSEISNL